MKNSGNLRNPDYYYPSERRTFSREYQEVIESILPRQWRIYPTHYWTQLVAPERLLKIQDGRNIYLLQLGHGERLLELNGVASHYRSGFCVLLYGLAGAVAETSALSSSAWSMQA